MLGLGGEALRPVLTRFWSVSPTGSEGE